MCTLDGESLEFGSEQWTVEECKIQRGGCCGVTIKKKKIKKKESSFILSVSFISFRVVVNPEVILRMQCLSQEYMPDGIPGHYMAPWMQTFMPRSNLA